MMAEPLIPQLIDPYHGGLAQLAEARVTVEARSIFSLDQIGSIWWNILMAEHLRPLDDEALCHP